MKVVVILLSLKRKSGVILLAVSIALISVSSVFSVSAAEIEENQDGSLTLTEGMVNSQLIRKFKEEQETEQKQRGLRDKYDVENEDVYVVEKNNIFKFLMRGLWWCIRVLAYIVFIALAAVGIIAIIYPDTRDGLIEAFNGIFANFQQLWGS